MHIKKPHIFLLSHIHNYTIHIIHKGNNNNNNNNNNKLHMWEESDKKRGKPLHGAFLVKLLNDLFGIQARGGCACAGPYSHQLLKVDHIHSLALRSYVEKGYLGVKPGWARINFPYYISNEEFEFILLTLEFIASYGQRFLAIYNFNWKSGEWTFSKQKFEEIMQESGVDCCSYGQKLAKDVQALSLEDTNNKIEDDYNGQIILKQKYASYLENAMRIARCLPISPKESPMPKDVDPKFLLYRV